MSLLVPSIALLGAGLTSSLSPCVLPLVPGYLATLSDGRSAPRPARLALFGVGATSSFVVLGAVAGAVGWKIGTAGSAIERAAGWALIVLAAGLIAGQRGWITFQFRAIRWLPAGGVWRPLILGIGCGAAWSPCVGPLLGAALTAAGGSGSAWRGSVLLASFSVGVLIPFLALAALPVRSVGPHLGQYTRVLPWIAAAVILLLGAALAGGWYHQLIQHISL
jgi:cytochrome c-type biogenesis protein